MNERVSKKKIIEKQTKKKERKLFTLLNIPKFL